MTDMKTISLDEKAYQLLKRAKRPGESFSEVVRRIAKRRPPLVSFGGAWTEMPRETRDAIRGFMTAAKRLDVERRPSVPQKVS